MQAAGNAMQMTNQHLDANRMKELILDKTLLKKVSETSRRYAIENFSSVKNSNSVFKLYKSML